MRKITRPSFDTASLKFTFRALRHRNYQLFFAGQGVSLIGTWMQNLAMSWLVYDLTRSQWLLGIVGFTSQIAALVISPVAGVLIDRFNKHHVIVTAQILAMMQALTLAALVLGHRIEVWHIIVLSLLLGLISGFDVPARQSFVVQMVENHDDLPNAIALNSSMFNGARFIGPAVAGVLMSKFGAGFCFLLNGISYIAVVIALLAMKVNSNVPKTVSANPIDDLKDGFAYTFNHMPIRSILTNLALISMFAMPYNVLMPVFATNVLHGGPHTLGFLMASIGIGAVIAAIYMASRKSVVGLEKLIPFATIAFGTALIVFSLSRNQWLSIAILSVVGFGQIVQMASSNTVIQTVVDERKRGRVMSIYNMAFQGTAPFGSLMAGALGEKIGAPHTVMAGGIMCMLIASLYLWRLPTMQKHLRPRYKELGISR